MRVAKQSRSILCDGCKKLSEINRSYGTICDGMGMRLGGYGI
jgi:hypothetical protein